jgi:hypothetical protein
VKIFEVINKQPASQFKAFMAKVRLDLPGYKQVIDVQIMARDLNMAAKLLKAQYGQRSLVGIPRQVGLDRR